MRRTVLYILVVCLTFRAEAQVWRDASFLPVAGKVTEVATGCYERLPEYPEGGIRPALVQLGKASAGLYIRFRSDSPANYVRWASSGARWMPHMAPVGTRGLDLYIHDGMSWTFAGSAKPEDAWKAASSCRIIGNMEPAMREYMLYLSLYDGISSLEIGVDKDYELLQPSLDSPRKGSPMVFYGTSILQGGCASRPGMAFTNILSRRFDREAINLGFSGNAFLDIAIAELMAAVPDPAVFVLDYVPNASAELIDSEGASFFRVLRDAHPGVPVVFVEDPGFPHAAFDGKIRKEIDDKNAAQKRLFRSLRAKGEKRIYYIPSSSLMRSEDTVDGIHPTDLGMEHYAEAYARILKKIL